MRDSGNPVATVEQLWLKLGCRIELPEDEARFLAKSGPKSVLYADNRRYRRFDCRAKAILLQGEEQFAVYMKDISRNGILFLHATQLFPRERVELRLLNGTRLKLRIQRCRKVRDACFECGAEIQGRLDGDAIAG